MNGIFLRIQIGKGVVVCSLGDGSITEGEVSEAFQMALLKKLPILYLVQDNEWDISAHSDRKSCGCMFTWRWLHNGRRSFGSISDGVAEKTPHTLFGSG